MVTLAQHVERWKDCDLCPLAQQRGRICLGRGLVPCDVLFVGEAPGASEDAVGQPFVGPAGDLLDRIERSALGPIALCATCGAIRRRDGEDWTCVGGHRRSHDHGGRSVITAHNNLVACFPREAKSRGENEPEDAEIAACEGRLIEFVNLAQPRLIVCVGRLAERWVDHVDGVPCVDIIHPAAILKMRTMSQKQSATDRAVVVLRNAVEDALAAPRADWRGWSNGGERERTGGAGRSFRRLYREEDIPF